MDEVLRFGYRQGVLTEVDSAGTLGKGDVEPVIYDQPRRGLRRNEAFRFAHKCAGSLSAKVLLANLNPINASGGHHRYSCHKRIQPIVARRFPQGSPVGDVAKDWPSGPKAL